MVDEDFARYYWPGADPIGRQLFRGSSQESDAEAFTVVGVVAAVKRAGMTEVAGQGAVYYPYAHRGDDRLFVVMRTSAAPEALGLTMQKIVRQVDPDLPVSNIRAMETLISDSLVTPRAAAMMAGIFSAIALLLSAIGATERSAIRLRNAGGKSASAWRWALFLRRFERSSSTSHSGC